ncbi:LamG-like jellyroll fold domain-containing protein [Dactylosporangium sp. NPDC051541]|uniref:LamG-like jellyroll fold domain-containing protein n=1 Tax=Dactylosporangium sp. NPDC051541 TaxID=3363977 RepID=UPI0037B2DC2B
MPSSAMRRLSALVSFVTFAVVGAVALPPATVQAQAPSCVDTAGSDAAASALAKACDGRVEVLSRRTETAQVFANPGGNYTFVSTLKPARVKRADGSWVKTDASLVRAADGGVAPRASALAIAFSGGGTGPIAQIRRGDQRLALRWIDDSPLPAPVLSGASAIYPDVLPGVDLKLTADVDGFAEVLVVKTRAAAANPALKALRFRTESEHVALKVDPVTGGVSAVDAAGAVVFGGSTPTMWDSASTLSPTQGAGVNGRTLETDRGHVDAGKPEPRQRRMHATADAGSLTVVPDATLLTDPATTFPVQIDPTFPGGRQHWTMLWKENGGTSYWDRSCVNCDSDESDSGVVRVGFQNFKGVSTVRSLFQMDVSGVVGAQISKATFSLTQSWSGKACGGPAGPTSLYWVGAINSGMTWDNSTGFGWIQKMGSNSQVRRYNGSGACAKGNVEWDAMAAVTAATNSGSGATTVGLRADNEGDEFAWRRYQLDPILSVEYNNPPWAPDYLSVAATPQEPGVACTAGASRPILRSTSVSLRAHVWDPNGDTMYVPFTVARQNADSSWTDVANVTADNVANNAIATVNVSGLADNGRYSMRVHADDYHWFGPTSGGPGQCEFDIDATAPNAPGGVTSAMYPNNGEFGGSKGKTGDFVITPPSVHPEDVDHYVYALTPFTAPPIDGTRTIAANPANHGATLSLTPSISGANQLKVWSVDKAGGVSPLQTPAVYNFAVSDPTFPVGTWVSGDAAGSGVLTDTSGWGHDAIPAQAGVVLGSPGRVIGTTSTAYSGAPISGANTAAGSAPEFDTARSFTVSAWVSLTSTPSTTPFAAVTREGIHTSAFQLGYGSDGRWRFVLAGNDVDGPITKTVSSDALAKANTWTLLTGTFDSATGTIRLYVDGAAQTAVVTGATGFTATGSLDIGHRKWAGNYDIGFSGRITDVNVWDRVLDGDEVSLLSGTRAGSWQFTGNGDDDLGRHPVAPVGAVTYGNDRFNAPGSAAVISRSGSQSLAASGPVVHTNQSFTVSAWVYLGAVTGTSNYAAVAQDGTHTSGFVLGYEGKTKDHWRFGISAADADGTNIPSVYSNAPVTHNKWTQLVGVYNANAGTLTLYVDGQFQGTTAATITWDATGPLRIGRATYSSHDTDWWNGSVDDVKVYQGAYAQPAVVSATGVYVTESIPPRTP